MLPQAGKGKRFSILHTDIDRLLALILLPPLVEPIGGDQAPAAAESVTKHRLLSGSLSLRVDRLRAAGGVFRPRWDQAPPQHDKFSVPVVGKASDDRHWLR